MSTQLETYSGQNRFQEPQWKILVEVISGLEQFSKMTVLNASIGINPITVLAV